MERSYDDSRTEWTGHATALFVLWFFCDNHGYARCSLKIPSRFLLQLSHFYRAGVCNVCCLGFEPQDTHALDKSTARQKILQSAIYFGNESRERSWIVLIVRSEIAPFSASSNLQWCPTQVEIYERATQDSSYTIQSRSFLQVVPSLHSIYFVFFLRPIPQRQHVSRKVLRKPVTTATQISILNQTKGTFQQILEPLRKAFQRNFLKMKATSVTGRDE